MKIKSSFFFLLIFFVIVAALFSFDASNVYGEKKLESLESIKKWADTPTLHVYGESASAQNYPFVEFIEGEHEWLDRVVKEKVVLMSQSDIAEYLELIGHHEITTKYIAEDRTIKYYFLRLSDPALNLEEHNVRAFYQYFTPAKFTKVNIDEDKIPQYLKHILLENDWTTLDDKQYLELKSKIAKNGVYYQVKQKNHAPNYWQIAYIGPELKEIQDGLFQNRQTNFVEVSKSTWDIKKPETTCVPVTSSNDANETVSYYERFSIIDSTGKEIRRISDENSIIVRFNPYNEWAEHYPFVFKFGIDYFDGNQHFTIYSDTNTISDSLCDITQGFQWEFVLEAGSYEMFIDRENSGDRQDYDRRVNVDKYKVYNALDEDPRFLDRMTSTPSFVDTLYKITSLGSGNIGVNIEEIEWSPEGSFILFKQHDRCQYVDYSQCVSESLWKIDLKDDSLQKIPLHIFEQYGNANELKVSPEGAFVAMKGYYTEQDGSEHSGLFIYNLDNKKLEKIIDMVKVHVTSFDWMPDGTILYHESITQNAGILWNIDKNGNILDKIYEGEPNFGYMDVSPDGVKVSFRAVEKEPGRSPPPSAEDFDPPGTITWFDVSTKEFFEQTITYNIYATTRWSPDNDYLYYLGVRPSPPIIGKLDVESGKDVPIVISNKPLDVSSTFSLSPKGDLMVFGLHYDKTNEYESIRVMDVEHPPQNMKDISESPIKGIKCGFGTVLLNEQCVSKTFAIQQGCTVIDNKCSILEENEKKILCSLGSELVDGKCFPVIEKKSSKDDAPFFGIFAYIDDLISWIFGK